ncbi:class I SAM-dependent methyltransferase [Mycolicibacterium rhodesiae]|uniref:SAM-dependent methyltransferase n=1 Tax=Mycolicibacterium rhodesiae TaxID=36814 RepID=A0A1X0IPJ6_MYCRH|nr:class I SAM-dependent methyltransferase [Mycolicibacterium rhodesiae]MCV7344267.1 class I SAM-dependent methyltransferase [Mycolicibacterium rhodesiae]ORB50281.1 SAM-dependent methyltransferase [Mycolicibacterium rhodesiae]
MPLVDRALAGLARQLGDPTGFAGRLVGRVLNRGNRSVVVAAVAAAERGPSADIADIGFGGGVGLDILLGREGTVVHGVEMSDTMLAQARQRFADAIARGRLRLYAGRMESLPLDDSALDAIISTNTVYFVPDLAAAFTELARVLRPGGRLVLGVGDPDQMTKMPFTRHGFRLRPIDELVSAIRDAGFDRIEDRRVGNGPRAFHLLVCDLPS